MDTHALPIVLSHFGLRTTENLDSNFEAPSTKGWLANDPSTTYARLFWGDTVEEQLYNRFEDTSNEYGFVPLTNAYDSDAITSGVSDGKTGYIGPSYNSTTGLKKIISKEFLRRPIVSIGELQSFPINLLNAYAPAAAEPIGNGHAAPQLPSDGVGLLNEPDPTIYGPRGTFAYMVDHSYISNKIFFDDWFASSIAPLIDTFGTTPSLNTEEMLVQFLTGEDLPNAFYKPVEKLTQTDAEQEARDIFNDPYAWYKIASKIKVDGMFNINSTSVEAWKGLLNHSFNNKLSVISGLSDIRELTPDDGAIFSRTSLGLDPDEIPNVDAKEFINSNSLTEDQVNALATAIVAQVKKRGPFLSLSEFVNRQLRSREDGIETLSPMEELARAGTIEAALLALNEDETNTGNDPNEDLSDEAGDAKLASQLVEELNNSGTLAEPIDYADPLFPEAGLGSRAYGYPGWTRQADILRGLAPILSARDDTFKIRAYGNSKDQDGNIVAEAWCEAVVSRTPNYVDYTDSSTPDPTGSDSDSVKPNAGTSRASLTEIRELSPGNKIYGRQYKLQSFKWLNADEV